MHRLKTEMAAEHKIIPCLLQWVWVGIKTKEGSGEEAQTQHRAEWKGW